MTTPLSTILSWFLFATMQAAMAAGPVAATTPSAGSEPCGGIKYKDQAYLERLVQAENLMKENCKALKSRELEKKSIELGNACAAALAKKQAEAKGAWDKQFAQAMAILKNQVESYRPMFSRANRHCDLAPQLVEVAKYTCKNYDNAAKSAGEAKDDALLAKACPIKQNTKLKDPTNLVDQKCAALRTGAVLETARSNMALTHSMAEQRSKEANQILPERNDENNPASTDRDFQARANFAYSTDAMLNGQSHTCNGFGLIATQVKEMFENKIMPSMRVAQTGLEKLEKQSKEREEALRKDRDLAWADADRLKSAEAAQDAKLAKEAATEALDRNKIAGGRLFTRPNGPTLFNPTAGRLTRITSLPEGYEAAPDGVVGPKRGYFSESESDNGPRKDVGLLWYRAQNGDLYYCITSNICRRK